MAAAVVELDALSDAVRPAAQDDHFLAISWRCLVLFFVGRVKIGRVAFELRGAGVHALVHGLDTVLVAKLMYFLRRAFVAVEPCRGQARVREAHALQLVQSLGIDLTLAELYLL